MERKRALTYASLSIVFALLCAAIVLSLLHPGLWDPGPAPSAGIFVIVAASVMKCGNDLTEPGLDAERRFLIVAGMVPVPLFLLSFYVPPALTVWLMALAAITLLAGAIGAFIARRKLRALGSSA